MSTDVFDKSVLNSIIFRFHPDKNYLISRESSKLEFKMSFNFAEIAEYLRDFAAFANNGGGYLVFGIEDSPHNIIGIDPTVFDQIDEEKITGFINEFFAPTIEWQKQVVEIRNKFIGLIYVYESVDKPVIALKDGGRDGEIKNGEIYYRYIGRSQKSRYPEFKQILELKLEKERRAWQDLIERTAKIGPTNVAILDTVQGKIESEYGTILIDDNLIPKLKFIKEGEFVERKGKPTLKLVGTLRPASVVEKIVHSDPYVYKVTDVARIVRGRIKKKFTVNSHTAAVKYFKLKEQLADGSWKYNESYCGLKEAINYFFYNQNWIDFLVEQLNDPEIYKRIVK